MTSVNFTIFHPWDGKSPLACLPLAAWPPSWYVHYCNAIYFSYTIFIIADTLQSIYLAAINSIFKSNTKLKYLYILEINILLSIKIIYINLGPIIESEASINSNYCILKTIFLEQLQLNYNNNF